MEKTENRNYGIDLLRIVSMMMVVVLHVLGQGGILNSCENNSPAYLTAWFLETASFCAVNCYALISGYVGVRSKHKYVNIIPLYLQVIFYTAIISAMFFFFVPKTATVKTLWQAFFPFAYSHYWYFTAYFAVFFFMPFMNKMLLSLDKKELKTLVATIALLFSFCSYIFQKDMFKASWGYSTLWIGMLYLLGGCIKLLSGDLRCKTSHFISVYAAGIIIAYLSKLVTVFKSDMVSYTSPAILLASVGLFMFFTNINIKSCKTKKAISFFAPLSFGVYLIHTEPLIWTHVMKNAFVSFKNLNPILLAAAVISAALAIWLLCSLIDFIRFQLFKLLKIKNLCNLVHNRICNAEKR